MIRPTSVRRSWMGLALGAAVALVLALAPTTVQAQQSTGVIAGTVTDAGSQRPLESAQVFIEGTGIGALTNSSGRYILLNVPAGQHTIRVQLVGFKEGSATVTVTAGQSSVADVAVEQTAIELTEIVVTGAGVATEKRKLGNTIATVDVSQLQDAPIADVSQLLQGREPGVVGGIGSGTTGEGSTIRIRGSASLSQSNEPLVYIDGIRVDNSGGFAGNEIGAGGQGRTSRLDDIDPSTIERIEILKGAAAATLYGTEASNGVIQIFTKRGRQGTPRFTFEVQQSAITTPTDRMLNLADYPAKGCLNRTNQASMDSCIAGGLSRMQSRFGFSGGAYDSYEVPLLQDLFNTGYGQTYGASVTGGSDLITYFASGRYTFEDGPFDGSFLSVPEVGGVAQDENRRIQSNINLNIFPMEKLSIRLSSLYSEVHQETPNNGNNIYGGFSSALMAQLRLSEDDNLFGAPAFATLKENLHQYTVGDTRHFAGSINANYQIQEGLIVDGTFGVDLVAEEAYDFRPYGWNVDNFSSSEPEGSRNIADRTNREITADFKLSWVRRFGDRFESTFLAGGQGFMAQETTSGGGGARFPGPGLEVAEAGADQYVSERFERNTQVGGYLQEQLGINDYLFLTVGGRWDANSAFGENFNTAFYPKFSASFIPTDAFGWESELVSTFRLRGAIGQSGLQPGAFDRFTTYEPYASEDGAGVRPFNLGNDDLSPEVSTEWELGTELGFFNDRAALDVTYWNRTVTDALVDQQFPPSGGFRNRQLVNIGELKATGWEIGAQGSLYQGDNVSININANASYISEEITSLGGAAPIKIGGSYTRYRNWLIEGFAPGAFIGAQLAENEIPLNILAPQAGECVAPTRDQALAYFGVPRNPSEFKPLVKGHSDFGVPNGQVASSNCGEGHTLGYNGKPTPDWQGSFGTNISFLNNFELVTNFEYRFGNYYHQNLSGEFRQANPVIGRNIPRAVELQAIMENPASTAEARLDAAIAWAKEIEALSPMQGLNSTYKADFLRFRELSLTYRMPSSFVERLGLATGTLNVGVRNLALWVNSDYSGMDPEGNVVGRSDGAGADNNFLQGVEGWGVPTPRRITASLRVSF
ncbi:MAG: SusC/RagA family TonB-linked outer membrane protein [Gemmatimonadota bacterium]|nr:SusC/RagA family TonB-linked outer membrane protein [Gemmatimonadota bacterium]